MSNNASRAGASCCDDYDPNSLPFAEALSRVESLATPVTAVERVAVREALGRILARDILSPIDVPTHPNSAMDGYALRAEDLPTAHTRELALIGESFAGAPLTGLVQAGECARIMTGGVMPEGTDTVLMQEHVERLDGRIRIGTGHRRGQNVRGAGEDVRAGDVVLRSGRRLQPSDLGVIASLGFAEVPVHRRVRVAFFSTGDELKSVGSPLGKGDVYDSNRYTLWGMLTELGAELLDLGVVADDRDAVRRAFSQAGQIADAVITSGGVSVGEADYVKDVLEELGEVSFWKIAVKPGRPFAFGRLGEAIFFGLPGNPVSVMVTFEQLVAPALRRMMGQAKTHPMRMRVRCASPLKKAPGRLEFQRGTLETDSAGEMVVRSTGRQGSHVLTSMSSANCYIVLPVDSAGAAPGDMVDVATLRRLE